MSSGSDLLRFARRFGTPLYVYDLGVIRDKCRQLKDSFSGASLYYACKANSNLEVIKTIYREGFGIETVSPGEIKAARRAGVPVSKITFTCSSIDEKELVWVVRQGIRVYLDSLRQVEVFGKNFPGREISMRLNQGMGAGHHSHVITGGPESKFGIDLALLPQLRPLARKYKLCVTGLHQHIGSNILDAPTFLKAADALIKTASRFPEVEHLDFGGGFGVPYCPGEKSLNIRRLGQEMKRRMSQLNARFSFEPGRFLVAEAGWLLVKVTDIKRNPKRTFIGVNSGMNHLIRPAMYGSYHEIENLSRRSGKKERVTIAGNICESGDVFAKGRQLALPKIGDVLVIKNAGAYGYAMASIYNLRPLPKEVLI